MPSKTMDPVKQHALRLLLSEIDRNPGKCTTRESRNQLYHELDVQHDLTYLKVTLSEGKHKAKFGVAEWRHAMSYLARPSNDSLEQSFGKEASALDELWLRGSEALNDRGRDKINWTQCKTTSRAQTPDGTSNTESSAITTEAYRSAKDTITPERITPRQRSNIAINTSEPRSPTISSFTEPESIDTSSGDESVAMQATAEQTPHTGYRKRSPQLSPKVIVGRLAAEPRASTSYPADNTSAVAPAPWRAHESRPRVAGYLQHDTQISGNALKAATNSGVHDFELPIEFFSPERKAKAAALSAIQGKPGRAASTKRGKGIAPTQPSSLRQQSKTGVSDRMDLELITPQASLAEVSESEQSSIAVGTKRKAVEEPAPPQGSTKRPVDVPQPAWQDCKDPKQFQSVLQLTDSDVREHHNAIYSDSQGLSGRYFEGTGANASGRPEWCPRPGVELEALYQELFGESWQLHAGEMVQLGRITAVDLVQGCIGAAVKRMVYDKELPWSSPNKLLEFTKDHTEAFTQFMLKNGGKHTFPEMMWLMGRDILRKDSFQKEIIRPAAEHLAARLRYIIGPQLIELGVVRSGFQLDGLRFWHERHAELVSVFYSALLLKGLLLAVPDDHKLEWVARGTMLNRATMTAVHPVRGQDPYVVAWCICPTVWIWQRPGEEWRVACPARVQSVRQVSLES